MARSIVNVPPNAGCYATRLSFPAYLALAETAGFGAKDAWAARAAPLAPIGAGWRPCGAEGFRITAARIARAHGSEDSLCGPGYGICRMGGLRQSRGRGLRAARPSRSDHRLWRMCGRAGFTGALLARRAFPPP